CGKTECNELMLVFSVLEFSSFSCSSCSSANGTSSEVSFSSVVLFSVVRVAVRVGFVFVFGTVVDVVVDVVDAVVKGAVVDALARDAVVVDTLLLVDGIDVIKRVVAELADSDLNSRLCLVLMK